MSSVAYQMFQTILTSFRTWNDNDNDSEEDEMDELMLQPNDIRYMVQEYIKEQDRSNLLRFTKHYGR